MQPKLKRFTGIVVGCFLGDSSTRRPKTRGKRLTTNNVFLRMQHSGKQKDYAKFKAELLNRFITTRYKEHSRRFGGKDYLVADVWTYTHPIITKIHDKHRGEGKTKTLDRILLNKLTPEGLAIWFMDDGTNVMRNISRPGNKSYKCWKGLEIATCSFSYEEHEVIKNYFEETWGIEVVIHRRKNYYNLYFNRVNALKFIGIIKEFIPECMQYKVNWQYGTTSDWLKRCSELDGDIKTLAETTGAFCRAQGSNYPDNRKPTKK